MGFTYLNTFVIRLRFYCNCDENALKKITKALSYFYLQYKPLQWVYYSIIIAAMYEIRLTMQLINNPLTAKTIT